jgi:GTP pyrophosphokinase
MDPVITGNMMPPVYSLNAEQEKQLILRHYRSLLRVLRPKLKKNDRKLIRTAFEMAAKAHSSMRRKSGEPYILHPISVAMICVEEIGLGVRSSICSLLHDTVEDTDLTLDDIRLEFDNEIARIVDGLTKISNVIDANTSAQAENFKKILVTLTDDPRVILIKLADRLHNMRTLDYMKREKQLKIASETVWVYAPLAHRMGLYKLKTELEDLSMKYLEPEAYQDIAKRLAETKRERTRYINEFIKPIKEKLNEAGQSFEIYGRPKSIHSIWNKMKKKGVSFDEVYDLFAIRIILDVQGPSEQLECWKVYSMIANEYSPSTERLRDWLSKPKSNGYEALHSTVMGPQGRWVEVQIRTKRMNEIAEKGLAAHYKYKEGSGSDEDRFDKWFTQIREVISSQDTDSVDFLQDFKTSFLAEEIYVYTPIGDVKMLPINSTALDFAFAIHSAVGSKCIGAKVNHKLVPISYILRSGDQVEILTSQKQKPNEDWLKFVVTAKARAKIKDSLREEKRKIADEGKYLLQRKLNSISASFSQYNIDELVLYYKALNQLELFYGIATKRYDLELLKTLVVHGDKLEIPKPAKIITEIKSQYDSKPAAKKEGELLIFGENGDKIKYTLAKCCSPINGDDVFGFVSVGKGLIIHRTNCPNAPKMLANYGHRIVKTKWAKNKEVSFLTALKIIGIDDVGVVNKITTVISGVMGINISALSIESNNGLFEGRIRVFVQDKDQLEELTQRLKALDGIDSVDRSDFQDTGTELMLQ